MRLGVLLFSVLSLAFLPIHAAADWRRVPALSEKIGDHSPNVSGVAIALPLVADDGSAVPLKVTFNGALEENEQITHLWIYASQNPNAEVIDFEISEFIPRIEMSTRIRLSETQTVYALARSNQDNFWLTSQEVRVTVSGCLMSGDDTLVDQQMSQPRVALPRNPQKGVASELRTMINHPMETGFREDGQGGVVPQQLVEQLAITRGETPLLTANFHTGTSANPFVAFYLDEFEHLNFTWTDQSGHQVTEQR